MDKQELSRALAQIASTFLRIREHPKDLYLDQDQNAKLANAMAVLLTTQTVDDVPGRRAGQLLDFIRASGITNPRAQRITGCEGVIQECEDFQRAISKRE